MYSKYWFIIRDDSKRTFEVCGQGENANSFSNKVHAMQKAGMSVSGMTPPVSNKNSSKATIVISGYTREAGLHDRLSKQYSDLATRSDEYW